MFEVRIGNRPLTLQNVGAEMNEQFRIFYQTNMRLTPNGLYQIPTPLSFSTDFKEQSFLFFKTNQNNYETIDHYFNNFTIVWNYYLRSKLFESAERLWKDVLAIISEWEREGSRVHKGTPFYYFSVTSFLSEKMEKAFLLMHKALEEDQKTLQTNTPRTPAYFFVTLDYEEQNQFFRNKVIEISDFLNERLQRYNTSRSPNISLNDFKKRFLEYAGELKDVIFFFVFNLFKMKNLVKDIDASWEKSTFGSLLQAQLIFDLCLTIESTIREKDPTVNDPHKKYFSDRILHLSQIASLSLNQHKLCGEINDEFKNRFSNTLQTLLNHNFRFSDGTTLTLIEEDLAIAYGFRNFGAHKIEDQPIVCDNFEEICQRILNALFFSVTELY